RRVLANGLGEERHHIADRGAEGIFALTNHANSQVAIRDDSQRLPQRIEHQQRADVAGVHAVSGRLYPFGDFGRIDFPNTNSSSRHVWALPGQLMLAQNRSSAWASLSALRPVGSSANTSPLCRNVSTAASSTRS